MCEADGQTGDTEILFSKLKLSFRYLAGTHIPNLLEITTVKMSQGHMSLLQAARLKQHQHAKIPASDSDNGRQQREPLPKLNNNRGTKRPFA
jgi:hypothetical protein